jgi:hypothetical protein
MSKEINYNVPNISKVELSVKVQKKYDLICKETGTGSITVYVNDNQVCDIIVSVKEKLIKK